jgi:hypothetical protein
MATKSMAYDHPTYTVRQAAALTLPAVAASTSVAKFVAFTDMKIKSIQCAVNIAGTSVGTSGYDILNGTTSVGAFLLSTNAAGSLITAIASDITLASGGFLDVKTKADSATQAASLLLEYEIIPGATVTA